jgi:putative hydrolase of the HAD superfamily
MDTVIFDLDDTLHDDTGAYKKSALHVARYVADRYAIDAAKLAASYTSQAEAFWEEFSSHSLKLKDQGLRARFWGRALAEFGISDRHLAGWCSFVYSEMRDRHLRLFPGVTEMLSHLRGRGMKLGLLTNGLAQTHRSKIVRLGLENLFDGVFLADEVGMVKPDPRVFLHACSRLGTSADKAVMVGDRYERDIVGAREAGLFTVWVNSRRDSLPPNALPPHATVLHVIETPGVLSFSAVP